MDVTQSKAEQGAADSQSKDINIGGLLVSARKEKKLTTSDIADQLNLTPVVIEQLESNQFEMDAPIIFVRGYIASYARKVGLDVESISQAFDRQVASIDDSSNPLKKLKSVGEFERTSQDSNTRGSLLKVIIFLVVVAILASLLWAGWKYFSNKEPELPANEIPLDTSSSDNSMVSDDDNKSRDSESSSVVSNQLDLELEPKPKSESKLDATQINTQEKTAALAVDNNARSDSSSVAEDIASSTDTSATGFNSMNDSETVGIDDKTVDANNDTTDISDETLQSDMPRTELVFSFSADCWVKVTDANDKVLAIGVKREGRVMSIGGELPVTVILGEPSAVALTVDDEAYDLSRYRAGRRAKFVLN